MKKVILMAAATLAVFATSFAQNATAPAPMSKMGNKAKTKAADAAAPAQQAGEKAKEMGEGKGHGKGNGEARGEGKGGMNALGLSAEQETKFKALNEGQKAAVQAVQKDASLAADAKKAQIDLLKSKYESDVQGVLNADQFAKWKEMRAKRGDRKEAKDHRDDDRKEGGRKSDGAATPAPANGAVAPANAPAMEGMKMKNKKKSN